MSHPGQAMVNSPGRRLPPRRAVSRPRACALTALITLTTLMALTALSGLSSRSMAQQPRRGLGNEAVVVYYEPRDEAFARVAFDTANEALPHLQATLGLSKPDQSNETNQSSKPDQSSGTSQSNRPAQSRLPEQGNDPDRSNGSEQSSASRQGNGREPGNGLGQGNGPDRDQALGPEIQPDGGGRSTFKGQAAARQVTESSHRQGPIRLDVVRSDAEFNRLAGYALPPWVQGVSLSGQRHIIVKTLLPAVMRTVVAHELTHALLDELTPVGGPEPPRWLHEGLAKLVTDDYTEADRQTLQNAIRQRTLLTLEQLDSAFQGDRQQVALAYAQSVSLVHYLHEARPDGGLAALLSNYQLTGGDLSRTLLRTYGQQPDELQAQWLAQITHQHRFRRDPHAIETLIFVFMVVLFAFAWRVRRRRAEAIRAQMQVDERWWRIMAEQAANTATTDQQTLSDSSDDSNSSDDSDRDGSDDNR